MPTFSWFALLLSNLVGIRMVRGKRGCLALFKLVLLVLVSYDDSTDEYACGFSFHFACQDTLNFGLLHSERRRSSPLFCFLKFRLFYIFRY